MFLFRRTDVKMTLLLLNRCMCVFSRLYSQIHLVCESSPGYGWTTCRFFCLFRELLLIDVSLNAKKVEPCGVHWPVSPPSWSQIPHWYSCTTVEIQSTGRCNSASLSAHRAHYWQINIKKSFIHIWIRVASESEILPASFWQVSLIIVCFLLHEFSDAGDGVRPWWGGGFIS